MAIHFKKLNASPELFFNILPKDWQDEIVPFWKDYQNNSDIFIFEEEGHVIGGGIVFQSCPPDLQYFKVQSQKYFDQGFLYVGFIYIREDRRQQHLGSLWLQELKKQHYGQKYWLVIEDPTLGAFYKKNGYQLEKSIVESEHEEWIYTFEPEGSSLSKR